MGEVTGFLPKVNPFEKGLRDLEIPLDIPTKYKNTLSHLINNSSLTIDELTGLPLETDEVRRKVANQLGICLRAGKKFAVIYTDTDNLKQTQFMAEILEIWL